MMLEDDDPARNSARISVFDPGDRTRNLTVAHITGISVLVSDQDAGVTPIIRMKHREVGAVERQDHSPLGFCSAEDVAIGGAGAEHLDRKNDIVTRFAKHADERRGPGTLIDEQTQRLARRGDVLPPLPTRAAPHSWKRNRVLQARLPA